VVPDDRDIRHLNCLVALGEKRFCTVFTLSPGDRREKSRTGAWHTEGKLLCLDFRRKSYSVVYEPLCQPHSMVDREGRIYLVESHTSTLVSVDPSGATRERIAAYRGFLRGLAFGPGEVLLGACAMYARDRQRLRPLPPLKLWAERLFPFSGLLVLDARWRVRRRIPIRGAEVYDILLLEDHELRNLH
jgi:hypothetical protein